MRLTRVWRPDSQKTTASPRAQVRDRDEIRGGRVGDGLHSTCRPPGAGRARCRSSSLMCGRCTRATPRARSENTTTRAENTRAIAAIPYSCGVRKCASAIAKPTQAIWRKTVVPRLNAKPDGTSDRSVLDGSVALSRVIVICVGVSTRALRRSPTLILAANLFRGPRIRRNGADQRPSVAGAGGKTATSRDHVR
jgi:hypothetical protein